MTERGRLKDRETGMREAGYRERAKGSAEISSGCLNTE